MKKIENRQTAKKRWRKVEEWDHTENKGTDCFKKEGVVNTV